MNRFVRLLLGVLLVGIRASAQGSGPLPRATPESQGVSSAQLLRFVEALDSKGGGIHSVMLVRHGRVVLEGWWAPYEPGANHELYSLSKSFTSTAVGFAVSEGLLSVDDEVLKLFPEDAPAEPSVNRKAMRVRDLLTMSTGHQDETSAAADRISPRSFLVHPVPHKPGTHFKYNTPATFMLSAIVQQRAKQPILEYLRPRLFEPLGITQPEWGTNSQGISLGGYALNVRTEDIAKFGQLYLQKGRWNGRQLLPESWIEQATARQVSNGSNPASDWEQGYGFQFWRSRHGAYRGDGAFGQYCVVLPEHDAVLAITSGVKDMQGVLNIAWTELLPAFAPEALRRGEPAGERLRERLAGLGMPAPKGTRTGPWAEKMMKGRIVFPANDAGVEWVRFKPTTAGWEMAVRAQGKEETLAVGAESWLRSQRTAVNAVRPVAMRGTWVSGSEFVVTTCYTTTPYVQTERFRFGEDGVVRESEMNVGFGGTRSPVLMGKME